MEADMAELDTPEFKFPDELENDTPVEGLAEGGEIEIEIEDDVPEEDRNRTPADPEKVRQLEVEVDDLDKYSKDAKDKIIKMKRIWNDERRAKEAALREQQATLEAARYLAEENKRIKSMLSEGELSYKEALEETAKLRHKAAKDAYKQAHEAGDSDALVEAQEELNKAQMLLDRAKNFKLPPLQQESFNVQPQVQVPTVPTPDAQVMRWQQENPWFGQDPEMTASALGLHEKLKNQGVVIGSEEYYAKLDSTMRKRFAEYFNDNVEDSTPSKPKSRPTTNVAPATRSTAPKKVRLTQSQVAVIKKLGITPEHYVREFLKVGA